ncbi:uncharacterized protein B0H64DRAFT_144226 [Chaetomium fimeti]|uniref:Uncharacterized protein n=1 Tax=Chaetomium fimeti TaxID=1854472 RepID=A0AAE0HF75_9PEZI|nr:hypothetical protein B0H64DRAFT_144226 [Chaetomium fimeti]
MDPEPLDIPGLQKRFHGLNADLTYDKTATPYDETETATHPHSIYHKYRAYKDPHDAATHFAGEYKKGAVKGSLHETDRDGLVGMVGQKWYTHQEHIAMRELAASAATNFQTTAERRRSFNETYEEVLKAAGRLRTPHNPNETYDGHVTQQRQTASSAKKYARFRKGHEKFV